jgi:nucleoside 2-deoxyribosyltransferase
VRPRVVLCGSFHRKPDDLRRLFRELEATGCRVLSPLTIDFADSAKAFVTTTSETDISASDIERFHLRAMRDADFVMLHAPDGHVGLSASYELGFASALGKPVFAVATPIDEMLATRVRTVSSVFEALDQLQLTSF